MKAVAALGEIPGTIGAIIVDTAQTANGTKAGKDNHNGHNPDGLRQELFKGIYYGLHGHVDQ